MQRSDLLQKLISELDSANIHLKVSSESDASKLVGDEIFHLPAISFCVLCLASLRSFKLSVPETGHFVASVLQESVSGLKNAQTDLRWSFRLRAVCADALDFLDRTALITIDKDKIVKATERGKAFLNESCSTEPSLELYRRGIVRGLDRALAKGDRLL